MPAEHPPVPPGDLRHDGLPVGRPVQPEDVPGEVQFTLHRPDLVVRLGRQDPGWVTDGHPADRYRRVRRYHRPQMYHPVDSHLGPGTDAGSVEHAAPGGEEHIVLDGGPGQVGPWADPHVPAQRGGGRDIRLRVDHRCAPLMLQQHASIIRGDRGRRQPHTPSVGPCEESVVSLALPFVDAYRDAGLGLQRYPTRRAISELLARRPSSVGELAQQLPTSRPAVSHHLRVLKVYRLNLDGVAALRAWLDRVWDEALTAFQKARSATPLEVGRWNRPEPATLRCRSISPGQARQKGWQGGPGRRFPPVVRHDPGCELPSPSTPAPARAASSSSWGACPASAITAPSTAPRKASATALAGGPGGMDPFLRPASIRLAQRLTNVLEIRLISRPTG